MTFSVTPAAAQEILAAAVRSDAVGMALRVAARRLRDGIDYGMGFDEAKPDDEVSVCHGLTVLVGAHSSTLLAGTALDYVEVEAGRHDFVFVGPQEPAAAGCATTSRTGCGGGSCGSCGG